MKELLVRTNAPRMSIFHLTITFTFIMMGLPLTPILVNVFMVELESSVIPGLSNKLNNWRSTLIARSVI